MHLGILQCDSVRADLQTEFGDYPDMFLRLLTPVFPPFTTSVHNLPAGDFPTRADECDAWLITGSKAGVGDGDEWIARAQSLVRALHADRRPTIGICFGHQLIASALGGEAGRSDNGWGVGVHSARLDEQPEWMHDPAPAQFALPVSHRDQVHAMPPQARRLASSDFCPIAMMQISDHALTFQGHPEFRRGYLRTLMDARRERLGEHVYREGRASLAQPTDCSLVARWIADFLAAVGALQPRGTREGTQSSPV